jgi:hypothetical protein
MSLSFAGLCAAPRLNTLLPCPSCSQCPVLFDRHISVRQLEQQAAASGAALPLDLGTFALHQCAASLEPAVWLCVALRAGAGRLA